MRSSWLLVVSVLAACGDDGGTGMQRDAAMQDDAADVCVPGTQPLSTVYLNFAGGNYTGASTEDARANQSPVFNQAEQLLAWPHANTAAVKACMEAGLAPFRITVTDVDPGTAEHHEIVFTTQFWMTPTMNVQSISSAHCGPPDVLPNSLTFVFGTPIGDGAQNACDVALSQFATASAHLDHTTDCRDYLGLYSAPCGARTWIAEPVTCGETTARPCLCGGTHQSSLQKMRAAFGATCAP